MGKARNDGEFCFLAEDPAGFAEKTIMMLRDPEGAAEIAARARREVEANWDSAVITRRLVERYRYLIRSKRALQIGLQRYRPAPVRLDAIRSEESVRPTIMRHG